VAREAFFSPYDGLDDKCDTGVPAASGFFPLGYVTLSRNKNVHVPDS
jgi:hypothetical protein